MRRLLPPAVLAPKMQISCKARTRRLPATCVLFFFHFFLFVKRGLPGRSRATWLACNCAHLAVNGRDTGNLKRNVWNLYEISTGKSATHTHNEGTSKKTEGKKHVAISAAQMKASQNPLQFSHTACGLSARGELPFIKGSIWNWIYGVLCLFTYYSIQYGYSKARHMTSASLRSMFVSEYLHARYTCSSSSYRMYNICIYVYNEVSLLTNISLFHYNSFGSVTKNNSINITAESN